MNYSRSVSDPSGSMPMTPSTGESGQRHVSHVSMAGGSYPDVGQGMTIMAPPFNFETTDFNWQLEPTHPRQDLSPSMTHVSSTSSRATPPQDMSMSNYQTLAPRNTSGQRSMSPSQEAESEKQRRRERNSIAARKYRQKRIDRINELEDQLARVEKERDDLRVEVERWKTKANVLEELTARKSPSS